MSRQKDIKTKGQKDKKTKRQKDRNTKRQKDNKDEGKKKDKKMKDKDQKENLELRRQGSFTLLQCFHQVLGPFRLVPWKKSFWI